MKLQPAFFAALAAPLCCIAQPVFPDFTYYVPAAAKGGGPAYVIPGLVDGKTKIGFTLSGQACEQGANTGCFNAAGVVTVKGLTAGLAVGDASTFSGSIGGFKGKFNYGALLMSIEGVGTVQVFAANKAHGLGSKTPAQSFTLAPTTFARLGFPSFTRHNARIVFYVADNRYADNSQGFQVNLESATVTYDGSMPTRKIVQVNGPCDWAAWDLGNGPCYPTAATGSESEVLGNDEGNSFVDPGTGEVIYLFGDTIGIKLPMQPPAVGKNTYPRFDAADAIATGPAPDDGAALAVNFFPKSPHTPQFVTPSPQPGKPPVPVIMSGDDVPDTGIHENGKNYIIVHTGNNPALSDSHQLDYSVLVQDDGNTKFTSGRTISIANKAVTSGGKTTYIQTGHFTLATLADLPLPYAQQLGLDKPGVLLAGEGEYRGESIYLAYMPASALSLSVTDNSDMRYFTGRDANGMPQWSATEMDAAPIVYDNPTGLATKTDPGTVGDTSLRYNDELGLWLMTWDGGRQAPADTGIYFSVAPAPWGPWSTPQLIYNACTAHRYGEGYGDFIHYVTGKNDICNGDVDDNSGPAGPIIGTSDGDPFFGTVKGTGETAASRRGGVYAPYMVPGLTGLAGDALSVDYNMSTWNPYAVVLMESNFTVAAPVY